MMYKLVPIDQGRNLSDDFTLMSIRDLKHNMNIYMLTHLLGDSGIGYPYYAFELENYEEEKIFSLYWLQR